MILRFCALLLLKLPFDRCVPHISFEIGIQSDDIIEYPEWPNLSSLPYTLNNVGGLSHFVHFGGLHTSRCSKSERTPSLFPNDWSSVFDSMGVISTVNILRSIENCVLAVVLFFEIAFDDSVG